MANTRIELIISSSTKYGSVDLFQNEPIQLQYQIADIKNIDQKKASYSKSFTIPGTKNNNDLFTNIFQINSDGSFDPRLKARATLFVDTIPVIEGSLQLTNCKVREREVVEYTITVFSDTQDLIGTIGSNYIEDLDWSDLDHNFQNDDVIKNSWTADTKYFYPLIDYGYDWDIKYLKGVGVGQTSFYPATNVKYIIDKIITGAGYTYSSTFLNTDTFKNLWIPFNGSPNKLLTDDFVSARQFKAQLSSTFVTGHSITIASNGVYKIPIYLTPTAQYYDGTVNRSYVVPYDNDSTNGNFDNKNNYLTTTYRYTSDTISSQDFTVELDCQISAGLPSGINFVDASVTFTWFRSSHSTTLGVIDKTYSVQLNQRQVLKDTFSCLPNIGYVYEGPLQIGEEIWCQISVIINTNKIILFLPAVGTTITGSIAIYGDNSRFFNKFNNYIAPNSLVDYSLLLPKKIKQIDFLKSISTMFNLYIDTDKNNSNKLLIEPRDTYFAQGSTLDWTDKLDISKGFEEQFLSELQEKKIKFSYKDDKDYLNEFYLNSTNAIYGEYIKDLQNEFTDGEKDISLIFSPTPLTYIDETDKSEFIVPKIGKKDKDNFVSTESNIRILQSNNSRLIDLNIYKWNYSILGTLESQTKYPYLGHLDHPITGNTDINFGSVDFLYYTLSSITENNLINTYWKKYLTDISDKNGKLITAYFKLSPTDINNLDFRNKIFIDRFTQDDGSYFIINKIEYDPTINGVYKVELLKLNNITIPSVINKTLKNIPLPYIYDSGIKKGNSISYSPRSIIIGNNSSLSNDSIGSLLLSDNSVINGKNNAIFGGNSNVIGYNIISGNTERFISGTTILGLSNYTATSSDTLYINNLYLAYSSSTINGIPFSAFTAATNIGAGFTGWTSSTGNNSIKLNNSTNLASGQFSLVGGFRNSAISEYSSILGGTRNIINTYGYNSFIGGGQLNRVDSNNSFIGSGLQNSALTPYSVIGGGKKNRVSVYGYYSSILGGSANTIITQYGFIGGGFRNSISGNQSSILGGRGNNLTGSSSNILGGRDNSITNSYSSIIGGKSNNVTNRYSVVVGGNSNNVTGYRSTIAGGLTNTNTGANSILGGGENNNITNDDVFLGGGNGNLASNFGVFLGGGSLNTASGNRAALVGGYSNTASGSRSFIGGGKLNTASGAYSVVVGGTQNSGLGIYSFIGGGKSNTASGVYATVVGGNGNRASGLYSFIGGGKLNNVLSINSVIVGGRENRVNTGTKIFVGGGMNNFAQGSSSVIGGGYFNTAIGSYSVVMGGRGNRSANNYSFIGGGTGNTALGIDAIIVGGRNNSIPSGSFNIIVGGRSNLVTSVGSFIGGGTGNTGINNYNVVVGGFRNSSSSPGGVIGGGYNNFIGIVNQATIAGGRSNRILTPYGTIGGGRRNTVSGTSNISTIVGGQDHSAISPYSFIGGGRSNFSDGESSFMGSGLSNIIYGDHANILNGVVNRADALYGTVLNGYDNKVGSNATASSILAGTGNTLSGISSAIIGGSDILSTLTNRAIAFGYAVVTGNTTTLTGHTSGVATLSAGAITIPSNIVTANSMIFALAQDNSTTGALRISARTAGTSFTITSSNVGDTGKVAWWIIEPAN